MLYQYVNIENDELLTISQLESFFQDIQKEDENYANVTFNEYIKLCLTRNNGSLEPVQKVDDFTIIHMVNDGYITQKTASIICNMELYATNDGTFYTPDGYYFNSFDELNEYAELEEI